MADISGYMNGKPVTIKQVAAACGVSKSTVSAALRNDPKVKDRTREKVMATAKELGYEPEAQEGARRLRMRGVYPNNHKDINRIVALMFPQDIFATNHFLKMAEGAMRVLNRAGYGIFLECQNEDSNSRGSLHPIFMRGDIDAVIACYPPVVSEETISALRGTACFGNKPIVTLLGKAPDCHSVSADTGAGSARLAKRLIELGHRKVLMVIGSKETLDQKEFVSSLPTSISVEKLTSFQREYKLAGYDPEESVKCLFVPANWTDPRGLPENRILGTDMNLDKSCTDRIWHALNADKDITAVICQNDPLAFRVWSLLDGKGIKVPETLSIVGFDDSDPIFDHQGKNLLTTVHLPLSELGEVAGALVLEMIESEDSNHVLISKSFIPSLVERASLGPANPNGGWQG